MRCTASTSTVSLARSLLPKAVTLLTAMTLALILASAASACPTCKESLAHDPASASLARGFYYSILFMVSMPFVIFGSLSAYFYWEVRKAKARQLAESSKAELPQPKLAL
jgi:heme/copper-type cytochrome/quinol oxidase subunit 2